MQPAELAFGGPDQAAGTQTAWKVKQKDKNTGCTKLAVALATTNILWKLEFMKNRKLRH